MKEMKMTALTGLFAISILSGCGPGLQTLEPSSDSASRASAADEAQLSSATKLNRGVKQLLDAGSSTSSSRTETSQCGFTLPQFEVPASEAEMLGLLETDLEDLIALLESTEQTVKGLPEVEGLPQPKELLKQIQEKRRQLTTSSKAQSEYEKGRALAKKNKALIEKFAAALSQQTEEQRQAQIACLKQNGPLLPSIAGVLPDIDHKL